MVGPTLIERLRDRRAEIESATLARVLTVPGTSETLDPEYVDGLRTAVRIALAYGSMHSSARANTPRPPIPLLARHAPASASTRCCAAPSPVTWHLGDYVVAELESAGPSGRSMMKRCLRVQAVILEAGELHKRSYRASLLVGVPPLARGSA
jgi:hypothetical protein